MTLSSEYRIKVIRELMKIESPNDDDYYIMQQDLRRISMLYTKRNSEKTWEQVVEEYKKSKYQETETDKKRLNIYWKIKEEKDLLKQNELIDKELEKDPHHYNLYNDKAYNLYELGNIKEGISEVLKAIKMNSNLKLDFMILLERDIVRLVNIRKLLK